MESQLALIEQSFDSRYSLLGREALEELPDNFTITDPSICGHPIVFASRGFLKMSGYSKDEVIGQNGRIFQGPATSRQSVMEIREAIREERPVQVNLLNYRKDGTPLWLLFNMCPVFSKEDGRVTHFVAVQVPILQRCGRRRTASERSGVVGICEDVGNGGGLRDVVFGSCRREVCSDGLVELGRVSSFGSVLDSDFRGSVIEEPCEASEMEKWRAACAINKIMSELISHSELTGRLVCRKRCCSSGFSRLSSSIIISLGRIKQSFVLTDLHLPDMPIVYVSDAFLKLTGYASHEVLGRNCRFLNGTATDVSTLDQIKESIHLRQPCTEGRKFVLESPTHITCS